MRCYNVAMGEKEWVPRRELRGLKDGGDALLGTGRRSEVAIKQSQMDRESSPWDGSSARRQDWRKVGFRAITSSDNAINQQAFHCILAFQLCGPQSPHLYYGRNGLDFQGQLLVLTMGDIVNGQP